MENTKKGVPIWLVIIIGIICLGAGYFVATSLKDNKEVKQEEKAPDKGETIPEEKEEKTDWKKFVDQKISERKDATITQQCEQCSDKYTIELTKDGSVLLTTKLEPSLDEEETEVFKYNKKEIFKNVILFADVHASQSDICNGNEKVIVVKEDGSVSFLDMDSLICGHELVIKENIGTLKEIVEIKEEKIKTNEYEPDYYKVIATDINGQTTDITELLEK